MSKREHQENHRHYKGDLGCEDEEDAQSLAAIGEEEEEKDVAELNEEAQSVDGEDQGAVGVHQG